MARIERLETFVLEHKYPIKRGPSIALGDTSAYILVKLSDSRRRAGWGETYLMPGAAAYIEDLAPLLLGRDPQRRHGDPDRHRAGGPAGVRAVGDLDRGR